MRQYRVRHGAVLFLLLVPQSAAKPAAPAESETIQGIPGDSIGTELPSKPAHPGGADPEICDRRPSQRTIAGDRRSLNEARPVSPATDQPSKDATYATKTRFWLVAPLPVPPQDPRQPTIDGSIHSGWL